MIGLLKRNGQRYSSWLNFMGDHRGSPEVKRIMNEGGELKVRSIFDDAWDAWMGAGQANNNNINNNNNRNNENENENGNNEGEGRRRTES